MEGTIFAVLTDPMVIFAGILTGLVDMFLMQMATLEEPSLSSV